ncbi:MAG: O-antigen ligase family protein [Vicinamibacteria bacterium]|nr:O-antigen ligase family protein [Vicinamibacteria bacterium]
MRPDGVLRAIAGSAFLSVCLAPFLFGAVERSVWIPLCQLWLFAGLASISLQARFSPGGADESSLAVSQALLPIHALFLVQLIPLPAGLLRLVSPGSFAAHFLPDPGDGRFRPLSVSPSATVEAWLYVAGLQGLFLALRGLPRPRRRTFALIVVAVLVVLAAEGLWQSRTTHPAWLYGQVPIMAPKGLDEATFGPYYNRNHFATAMALGAAWSAGLALGLIREAGGVVRLLANATVMTEAILLSGASLLMALSAAASGSRSGVGAAIGALAIIAARYFGMRQVLLPVVVGFVMLIASGAAAIERLMRLDLVMSRWAPWADMTRLWAFFPAFGSGIGAFGAAYWPYQLNNANEFWQHAHNEYLEWTIEAGIAGVLAAGLVARALRASLGFAPWAGDAIRGAIAAVALQALLDFSLRTPASAALLVCVIALAGDGRPRRFRANA